jgi:hypothetical protein
MSSIASGDGLLLFMFELVENTTTTRFELKGIKTIPGMT